MKTIRMKWKGGAEESSVICRQNVLTAVGGMLARDRTDAFVLTDSNVYEIYKRQLARAFGRTPVYVMPAGEENKNAEILLSVLGAMAEHGVRRTSVLVAVGGGVVGDLGGLAAALYMRGIRCIQVPTTLLAQVDSSVGGKTAIDFHGVKNLVGAFHRPSKVFVDPAFLYTLPPRELRCGLGEIVKHAALDGELFDLLTAQENLFDIGFLSDIVPLNIAYKASVVQEDPFEGGLRKCLNLGHTTAHALELASGLSHGECVLAGIVIESRIAEEYCETDAAYLEQLRALCMRVLGKMPHLSPREASGLALLDKKNIGAGEIVLTVPVARGTYQLLSLPRGEYSRGIERAVRLC